MLPLDDVKPWLNITVDTFDAELQALIDRASEHIENECGWYFRLPRPVVEVLDGTGTDALFLRQHLPDDAAPLVLECRAGTTDPWVVVPAADYELDGRGIYAAGVWARGRRNFRATYEEGFTEPPGDIAQLFLEVMAHAWQTRGREGLSSERIGDYSYVIFPGSGGPVEGLKRWDFVTDHWKRKRL